MCGSTSPTCLTTFPSQRWWMAGCVKEEEYDYLVWCGRMCASENLKLGLMNVLICFLLLWELAKYRTTSNLVQGTQGMYHTGFASSTVEQCSTTILFMKSRLLYLLEVEVGEVS